ncbi:MAG: hypothetical protein AAFX94_18375, partial [Myxococcota bacterium]
MKRLGLFFAFTLVAGCDGVRFECFDGIDNDGDGVIDGADPGCNFITDRNNALRASCNARDSGLNSRNPACDLSGSGQFESDDPECFDGQDNDGDGLIDGADLGCRNTSNNHDIDDNDETDPECADGMDNDGDGRIDVADPGCTGTFSNLDTSEGGDPECGDGIDNDDDGFTDFPADLGCASLSGVTERGVQCSDGVDNDADGRVDFPADPGCSSLTDTSELSPQCDDGVDNDRDGL